MGVTCSQCGNTSGFLKGVSIINYNEKYLCNVCAENFIEQINEKITITGTNNIEGFQITDYIDVVSSELIIAVGMFAEFVGDISDVFEIRNTHFEKNLKKARLNLTQRLKRITYEKGGNAVIKFNLNYAGISSNRMVIVASGTAVKIERVN